MNKKILLIDDDEDEQSIFTEAIGAAKISFDCIYANTAQLGIKLLDVVLPDFVFIDYNMPGMDGIECLKKIKEADSFIQTPVILYSTGLDNKLADTAAHLGAFACIKKTFSIRELAETLKSILMPNLNAPS